MFNYLIVLSILCNVQIYCLTNTTFQNVSSGNDLWIDLARGCEKPTSSCIKNTIYDYLKTTLDNSNDIQFTNYLKFSKNSIDYQKHPEEITNTTEELDDDETLEEISRSLSENTKQFFMTHDLEVQLPDTIFPSSSLKVSPRSLDSNGTTLKLELVPREIQEYGEGRIFFKKIRKFISERLIWALLAILLVVKLLAVKFLFVLPSLMGVVAAKKLIVKVLLFLFPFLNHLFKLCAYTPYGAKHHIHKHQISHLHQVSPSYHHHKPHYAERSPAHYFAHKDDVGTAEDSHTSASAYENEVYQEPAAEESEGDFWGLGFSSEPKKEPKKPPLTATELENMVLKAEKEALIKSRLQKERERIHEENLRLQEQLNNALKIQQKLKHHAVVVSHKMKPGKYYKHHHFPPPSISSLLPPPPSPPTPHEPSKFEEPPKYFGDPPMQYGNAPTSFGDLQSDPSQPGPFAEPPPNYVDNLSQAEELPSGVIGGGLPASTVDAVKNYLNQKNIQSPAVYPAYHHNQIDQEIHLTPQQVKVFVTPQNLKNFITPHVPGGSVKPGVSTHHVPSQNNVIAKRKSDASSQEEQFYKAAQITYDNFYSPILEKIDAVLNELEFNEEPCRERLICSMYKNPEKFSPHSNLISAELSRDSKDLQKPSSTNAAVIRFYKYVQAARDGQDQRDCIRLYPTCAKNTEA